MKGRFTIDGSDALERHLAQTCDRVRDAVRAAVPESKLEAILLGGGYGRGEGGVLKTSDGDLPYNDIEFYVCLRGNRHLNERRYRAALHHAAEQLTPAAGVEVEFKLFSLDQLRRSPPGMFYYDLVTGHKWVVGDEQLLAGCEHHRDAARIPLHEATRLLMNRCSGLLFAKAKLEKKDFTAADADFVHRNLAKARLAFGDAVLAVFGQYHWSCRERRQRLDKLNITENLPWLDEVRSHHRSGVAFKLHPERATGFSPAFAEQHRELTALGLKLWLWLESRRLNQSFASARDYAFSATNKCPETSAFRNRLINARTFGPAGLLSTRYPRERVLHALSLLLWEPEATRDPALLNKAQTELRTGESNFPGLVTAYQSLWGRFN